MFVYLCMSFAHNNWIYTMEIYVDNITNRNCSFLQTPKSNLLLLYLNQSNSKSIGNTLLLCTVFTIFFIFSQKDVQMIWYFIYANDKFTCRTERDRVSAV